MNILVTGGTGTVGSQVARELVSRGEKVSILTRDAGKARNLPAGATVVTGNLGEVSTVRRIFQNIDAVFLVNVVNPAESHEGLLPVCAMRYSSVKRIVYLSVHNADVAAYLPHFGAKVGVEEAIRRSGIPFTILRPNNFYQNDYWFQEPLMKAGIYPQPLGDVGLSRVDVRDIAEAAAVALTQSGHEGQSYDLVGPELHTGESTAQVWARALGRPVKYAGNDLDAWEKQSLQYMPDFLVYDFRAMYDFFQKEGLKASQEAIDRQTKMLGHSPRSFGAFAAETAAAWNAATK
jgi:uncharacterized protein YbjT (DUF2867 family)